MLSPFTSFSWNGETNQFEVTLAKSADTKFGLISVDGVSADDLIAEAKSQQHVNWLSDFPAMFPTYVMSRVSVPSKCFVQSAKAVVELEDLETHEIDESKCDATDDNYHTACETWQVPEGAEHQFGYGQSYEQHQGEDEEESTESPEEAAAKREFLQKRSNMDLLQAAFVSATKFAQRMGLSERHVVDAYRAAGGQSLSEEERDSIANADPVSQSFHAASASTGATPGCPQQ